MEIAVVDFSFLYNTFICKCNFVLSINKKKNKKKSITTIMNSAGWSSESTFSKLYNNAFAGTNENFGQKLLDALHVLTEPALCTVMCRIRITTD